MAEKITYYAMLLGDRTIQSPSGLTRRRQSVAGEIHDEALSRDLTWISNPGLASWERGDVTTSYVQVSEEEANRIVERFRARWQGQG